MPNNRQWAFIFWLAVFVVWCLSRDDLRSSWRDVARSAASPKILVPLAVLGGWVSAEVYLGARLSLWDSGLVADTAMWFITAGLVLFVNFDHASEEQHYFRRRVLATLGLGVVVEGFSEFFVLSLVGEVLLVPVLALLAGMSVVAAGRREHQQVKRLVDSLIALISTTLLGYVAIQLVSDWGSVDKGGLVRQLALPVWLTVGVLPYVYLVGLVAAYEAAFIRIDWKSEGSWWARLRSKLVLAASFHVKAREVGAFSGPWQFRLAKATSFRDGRDVVREFRKAQREAERATAEEEAQLVRYAGSDDVDADGRRLDRREFKETVDALQWLATCQMGWHNNLGHYRPDLLEFLEDDFTRNGLPRPSGMAMRVTGGGQAWVCVARDCERLGVRNWRRRCAAGSVGVRRACAAEWTARHRSFLGFAAVLR
jgi:hypothetical protein